MSMRKSAGLAATAAAAALAATSWLAGGAPALATTTAYGTVSGTLTTQGGTPLNGMCVNLYKTSYAKGKVIRLAPTGTDGTNGSFTQANVPAGTYSALFYDCGANTGGNPDPNYVTIFYGGTYIPRKATTFMVTAGTTTTLSTSQIPLGGTITGTVTDSTLGGPAVYSPSVGILIPGAAGLNLKSSQGWYIVCAASNNGVYTVSGVPTRGVKVVFAPTGWGCPYDSQGTFNFGFYNQSESGLVHPSADGTLTVNGSVTEGPSYPSSGAPDWHTAAGTPRPRPQR
jgi:hypothetical protein